MNLHRAALLEDPATWYTQATVRLPRNQKDVAEGGALLSMMADARSVTGRRAKSLSTATLQRQL